MEQPNLLKFSKQGKTVIGLIFILLVATICYVVFLHWKVHSLQKINNQTTSQLQNYQNPIQENIHKINMLRAEVSSITSGLTAEIDKQQLETASLQNIISNEVLPKLNFLDNTAKKNSFLDSNHSPQVRKELLAEIDLALLYKLIVLAELKLNWFKDKDNCLKLLQLCQQWLEPYTEDKFKSLKAKLQQDIEIVTALDLTSKEVIWQTIATLLAKVETLPYRSEIAPLATNPDSSKEKSAKTNTRWQQFSAQLWGKLRQQVKINHHANIKHNQAAYYNESLTKQQLTLVLGQIRFAWISENHLIYQNSINLAQHMLADHFDLTSNEVESALAQLRTLANAKILPTVAVTFKSTATLNTLFATPEVKP